MTNRGLSNKMLERDHYLRHNRLSEHRSRLELGKVGQDPVSILTSEGPVSIHDVVLTESGYLIIPCLPLYTTGAYDG